MSIDLNAFRLIANQSPDRFDYAQGDTLKASHSDTSHGEHTYRAATNAFLKMLPIYHNHERTFDNGTNLHGRTHATAGHDTGRRNS